MTERGRVRVEPCRKRIRVMLGGLIVADSIETSMVWEVPYYPVYYFPLADVDREALVETGPGETSPSRGASLRYVVKADGVEGSAYSYPESEIEEIRGLVAFDWSSMDHWFEEDEEVFTHPRDPYTRIDIVPSSRRIRVEIDGVTVADTSNAMFLFETHLPTRYYIPKPDVRFELLEPTDRSTACPYKGTARYWSVEVNGTTYQNLVWGYDSPLPESQKIMGMVSFYNEKVDIYVDEVLEERPRTKFS